MSENLTPIRFHFYRLKFTPYKDHSSSGSSNGILKDIITYLMNQLKDEKGHLIDKHKGREQEERRELFLTHAIFMPKEQRIRCTIALLRSGKKPQLKPKDMFKLIPLSEIGTIAEETNFFIDYSKAYAIICCEYNYHGPRISDIEYYLRNVGRDTLRIAKATEITMFMDSTIDYTLEHLTNVLNIDIKIQPKNFKQLDTKLNTGYFAGMNLMSTNLKPKFLKIETSFQTTGKTVKSQFLNKEANTMVADLLKVFKARPFNIEAFDNFVVKYEDKDGNEEVFNLLKGKKEILKEVDLAKFKKRREWYELIETDFNEFIENHAI